MNQNQAIKQLQKEVIRLETLIIELEGQSAMKQMQLDDLGITFNVENYPDPCIMNWGYWN